MVAIVAVVAVVAMVAVVAVVKLVQSPLKSACSTIGQVEITIIIEINNRLKFCINMIRNLIMGLKPKN